MSGGQGAWPILSPGIFFLFLISHYIDLDGFDINPLRALDIDSTNAYWGQRFVLQWRLSPHPWRLIMDDGYELDHKGAIDKSQQAPERAMRGR